MPGSEDGRWLSKWVNRPADENNVSPKSAVVQIATALIGRDLTEADDWNWDTLLHRRCRVSVETYQKTDGSEANKLGKFYPLKSRNGTQRAAVPAAAPPPPF